MAYSSGVEYAQYFAGDKAASAPKLYDEGAVNTLNMQTSAVELCRAGELNQRIQIEYTADGYVTSSKTGTHFVNSAGKGWGNLSYYIFSSHSETNLPSDMRLYSLTMKTDGTVVRDYIPVLDNNGVACLYDKVTKQCYYNLGSGDFVAGPVTYVVPEPEPIPEAISLDFQIGSNSGEKNMLSVELGFSLNGFEGDVSSREAADATLQAVDELKKSLVEKRAEIGVARNRIEGVLNSQSIKIENLSASHSTVVDTDFAKESATLVKSQILQSAASSLLKQANFTPNIALQLLS